MVGDPGFWRRLRMRAVLPYVVVAGLVVIAIAVLGEEIHTHLRAMEDWVAGLGLWGPVAFAVLVTVAATLLVPDTALAVGGGALFGVAVGSGAIIAGILVASIVQYALARELLRRPIERWLARKPNLRSIVDAVRDREVRMQVLIRLTPLSPAVVSYTMGAAGVRFGGFVIACLVMIPALVLEVYLGYAGVHVASMAGRPDGHVELRDGLVLGGLVAFGVVMTLVSRAARRAIQEAAAAGTGPGGP